MKYTITFAPSSNKSSVELEGNTTSDAISNGIKAGIDFSYADFSEEQLAYVNFSNCNLTGCSFEDASIFNCEFQNADLTQTDWSDAVIYESWFQNCNFSDSKLLFSAFVACDVRNALFSTARHIQTAAFSNLFDAILPKNYRR